jgi:hypothetical protein
MKRSVVLWEERHVGFSDVTKTYLGYEGCKISVPLTGAGKVPFLIRFSLLLYFFLME